MTSPRKLLLTLLVAILAPSLAWADPPRRVLHVSFYPYIPDAAAAALTLKQGFEREHPDVIVEMTLNPNYYSLDPAAKGLLYEDADVHEIDVVFLSDFLAQHKLAPLSPSFAASIDPLEPLAVQAATVDGKLVAVPQWMCTDFLIYRSDEAGLGGAQTFADMQRTLRSDGLLMDLSGGALGEVYLSFLMARDGEPAAALAHVTPTPDPEILGRIHGLLALEPPGLGRNPEYHERESFYARQFARRAGGAFVGYSEMVHEVLDETATSCRVEDRCVTAPEIQVEALPLEDHKVRPMIWVDMFGIDARVHGQTMTDAEDFVRYATSLAAFRALLIPQPGDNPRYLLPASAVAFADPDILKAAPLYPKFQAVVDQGVVVTTPHLSAKLHEVAMRIDADLPSNH